MVVAMASEAASIRRAARGVSGLQVIHSGVGPERARVAAERILAQGPPGLLVSAGVAGALVAGLRPGDALLPAEVRNRAGAIFACHAPARKCLTRRIRAHHGALLSADDPVATPEARARLAHLTGAVAVDMESAAIASVAAAHDVPFLALRVVSDPADAWLRPEMLAALDADGRVRALRAAALLARPRALRAALRAARGMRTALAVLAVVVPRAVDALAETAADEAVRG